MTHNDLSRKQAMPHGIWFSLLCLCMLLCCLPGQSVKASSIIDTVAVILPTPVLGQRAAEVQASTTTTGAIVISSTWYRRGTEESVQLNAGDSFTTGSYFCHIRIEPSSGYKFVSSPVATINGASAKGYATRVSMRVTPVSNDYVLSSNSSSGSTTEITTVLISLPTPQIGQNASAVKPTTTTTGARISEFQWFRQTGSTYSVVAADHTFASGTYYCDTHIVPNSGYALSASAQATINGAAPDSYGLRSTTKIVPHSKVFVLESITKELGEVRITLPTPLLGQKASDVVATTTTAGAVLSEAKWYLQSGRTSSVVPTDHTFAAGTYYYEVSIGVASGYAFPEYLVSSFNDGATSRSNTRGGWLITVKSPSFTLDTPTTTPAATEISRVDVTIPEPIAGKTPNNTVPTVSTKGVSSDVDYSWHQYVDGTGQPMLLEDQFSLGKTYYCYVILTADDGHIFSNSVLAYLNDTEATFTVAPHGMLLQGSSKDYLLKDTPPTDGTPTELLSITAPKAITDIPNGTVKSVAGLKLPAEVTLVTSDGEILAVVTWNVGSCSYDVDNTTAQTFSVQGTATLPKDVDNPKNISLTISISVTVNALDQEKEEFTVRYHANGGTGTPPTAKTVQGGTSYTTLATMFSRTGYDFTGWGTSSTGGNLYAAGASLTVQENLMLYAQWKLAPDTSDDTSSKPADLPSPIDTDDSSKPADSSTDVPSTGYESATIVFTIDSKVVTKNGIALPEIDVPAMIINGRTMIPFRYFIESALGGTANFDASTYTITATVRGHTFVMVVDETTFSVDGKEMDLPQAPTIVDSRTLVPLRLVETIAQSVGWDPLTRKATIIL